MSGRLADAESALADVLVAARAAPEAFPMMATCFPLGRVRHARGNLAGAVRTYEDGLRYATGGTVANLYHAAEAHTGFGQVFYERNELDRALYHITTGIELGRQVVDLTTPLLGLVTLAWIHQAGGNRDAALAAMNEACELRPSPSVVAMWNPAASERARLLLLQGRIDQAQRWTEERRLGPDDPLSYPRERDYLVLARVLVALGHPEPALRLLERLDRLAEPQGRVQSLIQIRTVRAQALQAARDHPGALGALVEALALARPEGFIRVFADEGARLATLLRSLITARPRVPVGAQLREQVSRILHAFEPVTATVGPSSLAAGLVEPLTARELEVLRLVADGRHNREIAQDLFVTLDTVKKHTSHILGKLGVTSRTHAVARARELDLLP